MESKFICSGTTSKCIRTSSTKDVVIPSTGGNYIIPRITSDYVSTSTARYAIGRRRTANGRSVLIATIVEPKLL